MTILITPGMKEGFRILSGVLACSCAYLSGQENNPKMAAWLGFLTGTGLIFSLTKTND